MQSSPLSAFLKRGLDFDKVPNYHTCHGSIVSPVTQTVWSAITAFIPFVLLVLRVGALQPSIVDQAPLQTRQEVKALPGDSPAGEPPQTAPAAKPKLVLADGTPVRLKFERAVSSSRVIAGEKLDLLVVEEVRIQNRVVINKESQAGAMVTMAQARGPMGRGGSLQIKLQNVLLANGETVPLRTVENVKPGNRKALAIVGMIATDTFLVLSGKDAVIPKDSEITGYVDGDMALDPALFSSVALSPQDRAKVAVPRD